MVRSQKSMMVLPSSVVSRIDVGRLQREVEALDEFLTQMKLRTGGKAVKMPRTTRFLDETTEVNKINLLLKEDRRRLLAFLTAVKVKAPVMHMSFSSDPSPLFMQKLITWLRGEIHPLVLIQIGLQPNVGAGAVVRTTNAFFDFSLRHRFSEKRADLIKMISAQPVKEAKA